MNGRIGNQSEVISNAHLSPENLTSYLEQLETTLHSQNPETFNPVFAELNQLVRLNTIAPEALADYLEDLKSLLAKIEDSIRPLTPEEQDEAMQNIILLRELISAVEMYNYPKNIQDPIVEGRFIRVIAIITIILLMLGLIAYDDIQAISTNFIFPQARSIITNNVALNSNATLNALTSNYQDIADNWFSSNNYFLHLNNGENFKKISDLSINEPYNIHAITFLVQLSDNPPTFNGLDLVEQTSLEDFLNSLSVFVGSDVFAEEDPQSGLVNIYISSNSNLRFATLLVNNGVIEGIVTNGHIYPLGSDSNVQSN